MNNKEFEVRLAEYNRQIARQKMRRGTEMMRRLRLAHHALGYRPSADRVRGEK